LSPLSTSMRSGPFPTVWPAAPRAHNTPP
jgi:hypothetical protein